MFLIVCLVSTLFLIILFSYLLPFMKERPSVRLAHSKVRIFLLFLFLIAFPIFVVVCLLRRPADIDGWRVVIFWLTDKPLAISYSLYLVFVFLTGMIVPSATVFHFFFSYKLFLRRQEYEEIGAGPLDDNALRGLRDLFFECAKTAGVKKTARILVMKKESGEMSGFSGCGIVGKRKNLALLVGSDFVDAYRSGNLDRETVRNIFLHETSHIANRDYFLPLWARQMVRTRAFTFAIFSCLLTLFFMLLAIAFASRGMSVIKNNLWLFIGLFTVVPSAFFAMRAAVLGLIGSVMREREYLADIRAAFFYSTPEGMANAIKKAALLLPKEGDFSASLPFIEVEEVSGIEPYGLFRKIRKGVRKIKQEVFQGIAGKMNWHPSEAERIEALGMSKSLKLRREKPVSPLTMTAINLLYAGILVFLAIAWSSPRSSQSIITVMGLLYTFAFVLAMVVENVFPMHFLDKKVFQEGLTGYSALHAFARFFGSKLWGKIHLNNFLTALTICSLTALSSLVFFREVAYIQWHRTFFFEAVLFYFLYCTALSVLLVAVYWSGKKRKGPKKEEVPIEMVVK